MQEETADKVNAVPGLLKAFVILGGIGLLVGIIALAVMIMLRATDDPVGWGCLTGGARRFGVACRCAG